MAIFTAPSGNMSPRAAAAIDEILTVYDTENLRHSLAAYPARIKAQRNVVNQARKALKDAELSRAECEAELLLTLGTETDDKGKPKYSNAEQRAAALLRRKSTDPNYLDAASAVTVAEAEATEAQDTLQMLLDEYQSARMVARLISAEMSVISELADVGEVDEVVGVQIPERQKSLVKEAF